MIQRTVIFVGSCLTVFCVFVPVCSAATMSFGSGGSPAVGDTFSVPVYVSAADGESLNAMSATVTFPPQKLRVVSLGETGIVDFWAQKPLYSNTTGTISFQGVAYNPGFSGKNGKVVTITFRVIGSGVAPLAFDAPSILANDGQGTDILTTASGISVSLREAVPSKKPSIATTSLATTSPAQTESPLATSSEPKVLLDVFAQPVNSSPARSMGMFSISNDLLFTLGLLLVGISLAAVLFLFVWYVWHRMHGVRRRALRHIAATDTALHAELFELHDALKEEVKRLMHEHVDRDLTTEEKHILTRFSHLVEKTERVMAARLHKK